MRTTPKNEIVPILVHHPRVLLADYRLRDHWRLAGLWDNRRVVPASACAGGTPRRKNAMRRLVVTSVALLLAAALPETSPAVIPVEDYAALPHIIETDLKTVAAYAQQVQQYQLQIQQYVNQLKNTLGITPALQIWQSAQQTMGSLMGVVSIFKNGSLANTLSQFQNVNYWLQVPPNSMTFQTSGSVFQKQANDAMMEGLVKQTAQIQTDAATLERLQSQAGSATGQMQALSAANELAALEQAQLLQIRALLVQEQQALAARNATSANDGAMRQAATQQYYGTQLAPEANQGW